MSAVLILQQRQTFKKTLTHGDSCTLTIIKSWHTRENQNNNSYPQLMLILLTLDTTVYICVSVVSNFICKLYPIICIHTIHLILSSKVHSNYAKSFFSVNWQAFAVSTTHTTHKNQMLSKWECGHGKMWPGSIECSWSLASELTSWGAAAARLMALQVTAAVTQLLRDGAHCNELFEILASDSIHFWEVLLKSWVALRHVRRFSYQEVRGSRAESCQWRDACPLSEGRLQSWETPSPPWETPWD